MEPAPTDIWVYLQSGIPARVLGMLIGLGFYLWVFDHVFQPYPGATTVPSGHEPQAHPRHSLIPRLPDDRLYAYRRMLHGLLFVTGLILTLLHMTRSIQPIYRYTLCAFGVYVGLLVPAFFGTWLRVHLPPRLLKLLGWGALWLFLIEDYLFEPFSLGLKAFASHSKTNTIPPTSQPSAEWLAKTPADLTVSDVMIPRVDLPVVDENDSFETLIQRATEKELPFVIVVRDAPDDHSTTEEVIGLIRINDLVRLLIAPDRPEIQQRKIVAQLPILSPPVFADSQRLTTVWHEWSRLPGSPGVGLVYDEFGAFQGIVFRETVMDALLLAMGEELESQYIHKEMDGWRVRGRCPIEMFWQVIGKDPETVPSGVETVAGWVGTLFAHIPNEGESIQDDDLEITVTRVNNNRIDEVIVRQCTMNIDEKENTGAIDSLTTSS